MKFSRDLFKSKSLYLSKVSKNRAKKTLRKPPGKETQSRQLNSSNKSYPKTGNKDLREKKKLNSRKVITGCQIKTEQTQKIRRLI